MKPDEDDDQELFLIDPERDVRMRHLAVIGLESCPTMRTC